MTIDEIRSRKEDQTFDSKRNVAVNVALNAVNVENVALNTKSLAEHWDLNR